MLASLVLLCAMGHAAFTETVLVEAESCADYGGWLHDSQFMDQMGSPFLLAHGLGTRVKNATTQISLAPGIYRVWVRTRDWVATWNVPGTPGRFQLLINGRSLETTFGTEGAEWHWQDGGEVSIETSQTDIAIHDLTGFAGRCDAILLTQNVNFAPPNDSESLKSFRSELLGFTDTPEFAGKYDLVVVGGGIAGTCAAISAARNGLSVALIQDRPVLGGNNSSEVRVWLQGARNITPWENIGNVVAELEQKKSAHYGPTNTADLYEDERKLAIVRAEKNITLFVEHRVDAARKEGKRIVAVEAQQTRSGRRYRFEGAFFADCTGDGILGFAAGADSEITTDGHMGPCNLWNVTDTGSNISFPRCPWALDLADKPFPGRANRDTNKLGGWYWESGFFHDPIQNAEYIRDWNFRAAFGAWDALKNTDKVLATYQINWMAHIAGKRESRRLFGDVVLTLDDLKNATVYDDGAVPTGWPVDLHLPDLKYQEGFGGDEFISIAHYTNYPRPYWIPYRCLYSRNIENLFMAGRNISVTHEALGATRVMRTGGCMGEIVGMAVSLCKEHHTTPRGVYQQYLGELKRKMQDGVVSSPDFSPLVRRRLKPMEGNLATRATVSVSSAQEALKFLTDAVIALGENNTRWVSDKAESHTVTFVWEEPVTLSTVRVVSGYDQNAETVAPISAFHLETLQQGEWLPIPEGVVENNTLIDKSHTFPRIITAAARIVITVTPGSIARIWEVEWK